MAMVNLKKVVNARLFSRLVNIKENATVNLNRKLQTSCKLLDSFNIQDNEDFTNRVLKSQIPVIVDFHADWCGPCKLLAPRLESLIDSYSGNVHLAKVNIDNNTELAIEYGVDAVPCVIGFKEGRQIDKFVGLREDDILKSFVDKVIGPKLK